jgi:hypothetical protein
VIEDAKIKDALLALAEAHKTRTIVLSTLINEVAALRETWEQEKGEQFSNYLRDVQSKVLEKNAATETAKLRLCDELIERVKAL